jgi:hypothetical protein
MDLYVSASSGDDRHDGASWSEAFRTLERAEKAAGAQLWTSGLTIHLRGTFHVDRPLVIDGKQTTWSGEPGAVISGAVPLRGWQADTYNGIKVWSAPVPEGLKPRELFVGRSADRADRPRLPEEGFYRFAGLTNGGMNAQWNVGQGEATFRPGEFPRLRDPSNVEVVAHHFWVTSRLPIAALDYTRNLVTFKKKSVFRLSDDYTGYAAPYYLDNVGEALHRPGQWYWDTGQKRVYYVPRHQDRLRGFQAEVPELPCVVLFKGSAGCALQGVEVRGAEWSYPADASGDGQAAISVPGSIQIDSSEAASVKDCLIRASGTYGIEVQNGSFRTDIRNCTITDLGGGGVKVGHGTRSTTVTDCRVVDCGKVHTSAVGIWIGNSGHNLISHDLIWKLGYTGISVGWSWGYGPSDAVDNRIEWNDIRDIGQGLLSDMGGIYTLGVSPGTVLTHNRIENVQSMGYGGWGIYLDEGSSQIVVDKNVVLGCKTGSFHQHYGRDNQITRNIFAFAQQDGQIIRSRPEEHNSFTMERNVIVWRGTPLFGGNLQGPGFVFRSNVLWKTDGAPELPAFVDGSNTVTDPRFRDPLRGDFRLVAGSPAAQLDLPAPNDPGPGPRTKGP